MHMGEGGFYYLHTMPLMSPEESYSRQLDRNVQLEERPYGYIEPSCPASENNHYVEQDYMPRSRKHQ